MELNGLTHSTADLERSSRFYEEILGFEPAVAYVPTRWQSYKMQSGVFFALGEPPGSTEEVSFLVDDLNGLWARLKDQVQVVNPLERTPWGTYRFVIRDPDGRLLAFGEKQGTSTHQVICAQYHATLEMLRQAVSSCPAELWNDPGDRNRFWHVAYHALFYTHLYLHPSEQVFKAWEKHRENYESIGRLPYPPHDLPKIGEPYAVEDVLAFYQVCYSFVDEIVPRLNLDGESGFPWLPIGKLELQFYNIRHLQLHTGELMERLGSRGQIDVHWVVSNPPQPDTR